MKIKKIITLLVLLCAACSLIATCCGIFSTGGSGRFEIQSVRGEKVSIYGDGLYQHMSADVAVQGIAQDYITLFVGIPLLLISLYFALKNSLKGLFLLSGTLGYFFLTYLFYTAIAMYNAIFILYVILLALSFFTFILTLFSYQIEKITSFFNSEKLIRNAGIFLIINASLVSLMWLSIIIPPLLDGTIIPKQVQHYTTLIVQGFDLGLFLPAAFITGILALKKNPYGYVFTIIYIGFLSLLMTALSSKILFMMKEGANVIPAIFIMPVINITSIAFLIMLLKNIKQGSLIGKI